MAITGKFQADFSSFLAATQAAEVKLRSFEEGAGKAGAAVNRMANSLSGNTIIQQASVMAEAVERVGGVSKLTERELARVSATASEAAAKLRAMGQDVPPGIQKIADATKGATTATFNWQGALLSAASAFGIAFSAQALIGFVGRVIDSASRVDDLAKQLKVSTDAVQRWDYAIKLSGGTIDDVDRALSFMNKTLGAGDASTRKALADAGLEFAKIRAMKPEEAFEVTVTAVGKMTDAMKQAEVQQELFGKGGKAMLAAMSEGFVETGNQADIMSKETIERLDKAGDAWTKLGNKVTIISGEMIASISKMLTAWKSTEESQYADRWFAALHLNVNQAKEDLASLGRLWETVRGKTSTLPSPSAAPKPVGPGVAPPTQTISELLAIGDALDKEREAAIKAAAGITTHSLALQKTVTISPEAQRVLDLVSKAHQHQKAELEFAASAWKAWEKSASEALANVSKNSAPLKLITRDLSSFAQMVSAAVADSAGNLAGGLGGVKGPGLLEKMFGTRSDVAGYFQSTFGDLSNMLSFAIQGGQGVGGALKSYATNVAKDFAGAALSFIPGIGPILSQFASPIVDGLKKMFGSIFGIGTAGRDLVKDFTAQFGGFDAFHEMLGKELPADAERLWIALTQGVGRNNPEQAKKIIAEITAALEAKKTKTQEAAAASAAAAISQQAELDAISAKYSEVIGKLDSEYKSLSDSVAKEAEEEFMGLTEIAERERMRQIEDEKKFLEAQRDAEIESKKSTFEEMLIAGEKVDKELRELFGKTLKIPYEFVPQNAPGGATYTPPVRPPATTGGDGGSTVVQFVTPSMQVIAEGVLPEMPAARRRLGVS